MVDDPNKKKPSEPQSEEQSTPDADATPNPFDPDSLRITGDVNTIGAEKLLVRLAVRKPTKQEYFRVRTDQEFRLSCAILEIKEEREFYLVTPDVLPVLAEDVRHVELRLCLNRQGVHHHRRDADLGLLESQGQARQPVGCH